MNVFVLCTGRCGSVSFYEACKKISNYSSGHESNASLIGDKRLTFDNNHIEIDNRLSFHLGSLEEEFGNECIYVHLKRDRLKTAESFMKRYTNSDKRHSIIWAFAHHIKFLRSEDINDQNLYDLSLEYVDTISKNIELFLKNKENKLIVNVENFQSDFEEFWNLIGAKGDIHTALMSLEEKKNTSTEYRTVLKDDKSSKISINKIKIIARSFFGKK